MLKLICVFRLNNQASLQEFGLWYADMGIAEELDGESYGRNKMSKMN